MKQPATMMDHAIRPSNQNVASCEPQIPGATSMNCRPRRPKPSATECHNSENANWKNVMQDEIVFIHGMFQNARVGNTGLRSLNNGASWVLRTTGLPGEKPSHGPCMRVNRKNFARILPSVSDLTSNRRRFHDW